MFRHQVIALIGFVMSLGLIAQNAGAQTVVFDCQKKMDISEDPAAPEVIEFGITVVETAGTFVSTLKGTSDPAPQQTVFQLLPRSDAFLVGGVSHVLEAIGLDPAQRAAINTVKIYTTGNFDDDAAGVRAADFLDINGTSLAKGMFFGWGGPHQCD
ncbi:MAG: hypothetical protein U1E10_18415 [Bdellovibrionales bacterium]|nr:hypothetical protein [Bdellovibrionales bacterium]